MPSNAVLGALAIGVSLPVLWWSVASARGAGAGGSLLARFLRRGEKTTDLRQLALAESAGSRVLFPALKRLTRRIRRVTPAGWVESIERDVTLAGLERSWPVEKVLAANVLTAAGGAALAVWQLSGGISVITLASAALAAGVGALLPSVMLSSRARVRQEALERELPDALDQITMGVEAGLGFEGALLRVAEGGRGPLAEELTRLLKEMHIGVTRSTALRNLTERTDVADLDGFVIAVTQAEQYGLPIAQVLRVQAAELRVKRRQRAEEKAMKLPLKLVFPLGLCIFPALFIVLVGPGAIRIYRALIA